MVIHSNELFSTGAFTLNKAASPYEPFTKSTSIYLTQEGIASLRMEIMRLIAESKDVIKICSFIITDRDIYEVILSKARSSNTAIFILTQLDQEKLKNASNLTNFVTEEEIRENAAQTHLSHISRLYQEGVHVRASTSAHAKFIIADRKIGFITSANLTTPSLTLNTESGVYLSERDSQELDHLFDAVFQKGTSYRQYITINRRKGLVAQTETSVERRFLPDFRTSSIRYTYEKENTNLYSQIIDTIKSAKEYLYISTFSIVRLDLLSELVDALRDAVARGVEIFVFCRAMNHRRDHLLGSNTLSNLGCLIYADVYNHSKGIINEHSGMLFTANIDGHHGLINGFEVGCLLDQAQRLEFLSFHKHLIKTSIYKFERKPSRSEVFETYTSYEKAKAIIPPRLPNNITISYSKHLQIREQEIVTQPIFFSILPQLCILILGNTFYKCSITDGTFQILDRERPRYDIPKYILKYTSLTIIST